MELAQFPRKSLFNSDSYNYIRISEIIQSQSGDRCRLIRISCRFRTYKDLDCTNFQNFTLFAHHNHELMLSMFDHDHDLTRIEDQ